MSEQPDDGSRLRRILSLRRAWRRSGTEQPADAGPANRDRDERDAGALDTNDKIRAEAPNDLETRRRADQLEREIKHRDHEARP